MMDATAMFPRGFHPLRSHNTYEDILAGSNYLSRSNVPVTYYYIDFGLSTMFSPDDTERLVTGTYGLDRDVPELSDDIPYDPFKVDIFTLGNVFRQYLVEVCLHNICVRVRDLMCAVLDIL